MTRRRRSGTRGAVPTSSPSRGTPTASVRRRSAPTVADRHRECRQHGEGLGRQERCRDPHTQGAHRRTSLRRRSARTGRGSSPRVATIRRRSGTCGVVPRSSHSRGTPQVVRSASFSPDGSRIVTASGDKTAKVWDAASGAEILTLKGHTDTVFSASFSPDGSRIVTASRDNTAKVWDATTGAEVLTLKGHTMGRFGVVQPRRLADRDRELRTRRRRSGTPKAAPKSSRSRDTPRRSFRRRSARTGRGSSQGVLTARRGSGMRGRSNASSSGGISQAGHGR